MLCYLSLYSESNPIDLSPAPLGTILFSSAYLCRVVGAAGGGGAEGHKGELAIRGQIRLGEGG